MEEIKGEHSLTTKETRHQFVDQLSRLHRTEHQISARFMQLAEDPVDPRLCAYSALVSANRE